MDQAPLGLADPTADNVLVDGISRVFAELACQVVDTEVEVVRNVLKRDILGIVLIDVGADLLHDFSMFIGLLVMHRVLQTVQNNTERSIKEELAEQA